MTLGRILDREENGEIFSEGSLGKGKVPTLWVDVFIGSDKNGPELKPVKLSFSSAVYTASQDPRLTSCWSATQFYKTVLNLQRLGDASRMMKTTHLSGKKSRARHFEPWLPTQSVDSFTTDHSKDLTSQSFKIVQSPRWSLFSIPRSPNELTRSQV